MVKKIVISGLMFAVMLASNAMADDSISMGVFKGSFRDIYPDALVQNITIINNGGSSDREHPAAYLQKQTKNFQNEFASSARNFCKSKSKYSAVDQFEVSILIDIRGVGTSALVTANANLVCFDLPAIK
jgi:hypothetical protein